ncbi:MAG TPA: stalk domain-containing protein [Clostridia bacterium]
MKKLVIHKILIVTGALLISGLSTVGAATVYQTVTATLRPDIVVKLDDQAFSLKDGSGKTITPIVVNGSTYLPVRAISSSMGLNIGWDDKTQTVNISHNAPTNSQIGVRGKVKNIVKGKDGITFTVEGKKQIDTLYDIATVTVNSATILENVKSYSNIKEGDIVEATFPEFVVQSYPVMSTAVKLTVIGSNEIAVRGTVKDIVHGADGMTFMVEGSKESDTLYGKATVTVNMKTIVENAASFGDIKEGNTVEVKFKDVVSEPGTEPVMGVASAITVITKK